MTREEVTEGTLSVLKNWMPECAIFDLSERFIQDMHLMSDDASAIVLDVQKLLRIKPPLKSWKKVETIGDMIDLLVSEAAKKR